MIHTILILHIIMNKLDNLKDHHMNHMVITCLNKIIDNVNHNKNQTNVILIDMNHMVIHKKKAHMRMN